jgi:KAP family P-loop domain
MAPPNFRKRAAVRRTPAAPVQPRAGGGPHPAPWFIVAALAAAALVYGFLLQPPRADPFAAPAPLISLDWWLYPQPHRAMTAADAIPVGPRGVFVSRSVAERLRAAGLFDSAIDAALVPVTPDKPESLLVLVRSGSAGIAELQRRSGSILDNSLLSRLQATDQGLMFLVTLTGPSRTIDVIDDGCSRIVVGPAGSHALVGVGCPSARSASGQTATVLASNPRNAYALLSYERPAPLLSKGGIAPSPMNMAAQSQVQTKGGPASAAPNQAGPVTNRWEIAVAPAGKTITDSDWRPVGPVPATLALRDLAVAGDDSFGVAVGDDGAALRFEPPDKLTALKLPVAATLSAVHVAGDGSVWAVSPRPQDSAVPRAVLVSYDKGDSWRVLDQRRAPGPWTTYLALPFFLFTLGGGIRAAILRRKLAEAGTPYVSDIPTNDRPIGLDDHDSLNFRPIARAVELFIRNINTEPPIIIAITGEWGSGKSSLMNLVYEMLKRGGSRPVWFNAWHHQKEENLLAALLENIRGQAIPRFWTWPGLSFRLRLLRRRLGRELRGIIALFVFAGALALLLYVSGYRTLADFGVPDWLKFAERVELLDLPLAIALPVLGWRLLRLLKVFPDSAAALLAALRRPKAGDIRDMLNFRYRFAGEFEEAADVLRTPLNPGMVIFIDDLDRCRPDNVVEILEALNFISAAGKCVVVLGISKRMVSRAIWRAHEDLFKDEWGVASDNMTPEQRAELQRKHQAFSENYLEKLINIELALPLPTEEQSRGLLMPAPEPPPWRGWAASIRATKDWVYELGPSIVAACLLLLAFVATPAPPRPETPAPPPAATVATPAAQPPAPAAGTASPVAPGALAPPTVLRNTLSAAELEAKYADHGWATHVAIGVVCVLLLLAFAIRYIELADRTKVSDTPDFEAALRLWAPVVREGRPTPRFLKRYKNRVRYFAMRMRPMPEEEYVADRFARWLFGRFGGTTEPAPPRQIPSEGEVHEANVVALTALRVLEPGLVATAQGNLAERVRALAAAANDDLKPELLRKIEATLSEHQRLFGERAHPLDDDLARFNDVAPQDPAEIAIDHAEPENPRPAGPAIQIA